MKQVRFRRHCDYNQGTKRLAICSRQEDKKCVTFVRKNFKYIVTVAESQNPEVQAPEIFIRKIINSRLCIEKFHFQVKGCFYMTHNRQLVKVIFHHKLYIQINWKIKDFSPKKSAVLTK